MMNGPRIVLAVVDGSANEISVDGYPGSGIDRYHACVGAMTIFVCVNAIKAVPDTLA